MKYIEIYPQIPGALSEWSDTEVVNAKLVYKNYVMVFKHDVDEVDDLLESEFHYLFSKRLKKGIEDSGMRGLSFVEIKSIEIDTHKTFGRKYYLGKIDPFEEGADIFVDELFNLQVSTRFCDLLKNYRIDRASIGELPLGARIQDEISERLSKKSGK